jgi:methyl-accepting chemotaxis protein
MTKFVSTIKAKLILGLSIMALLVVLSSAGGLLSVFSLEDQLNTITDEAGPTIEETDDLIAGLWESAKVANEILASEDLSEVEILAKELDSLSISFNQTYKTLRQTIDEQRYIELVDSALKEHQEFDDHVSQMIEAHTNELNEEEKAKSLLDEFDSQGAELIVRLDEFAIENEAEMQKAEDDGDAILARGGSAAEINDILGELFEKDYPVVEASLKLQRLIIEMQDTSGEYLAEEDPTKLPDIKANFDELVVSAKPFFDILTELAESEEDRQDASDLIAAFDMWISLANSDEQLFDSYRDQLDMEYKADQYTEELEKDVDNADLVLEQVAETSDLFMDSADENAAESVTSAIAIQIGFIIASLIVGTAMILLFIKLLIGPLRELSARLHDIAQGDGDLTQRVDDSSNDEVGNLAKGFNIFVERIQDLIKKITFASEQISSSVNSMDSLIGSVAGSVESQSKETDSTAHAIKELSQSAKEINSNIQNVSSSTSSASDEGKQAKIVVEESVDSIRTLARDIEDGSEVVSNLNSEAENIGTVLTVIRGIAEQTNLLALNAAIEAARAGEQGRGFAVVADEVRTLAARTQNSTEEIQTMIERLQLGTSQAVQSMERSRKNSEVTVSKAVKTGELLDNISASVIEVDDMVAQITRAVDQQSLVTSDVSDNISNIVATTVNVSSATDETTQHAQGLNQLGQELAGLVKQFRV